jgi:hypothetical protein
VFQQADYYAVAADGSFALGIQKDKNSDITVVGDGSQTATFYIK